MPKLNVIIDHQLAPEQARGRLVQGFEKLSSKYGAYLSGMDVQWSDDALNVAGKALGQNVSGKVIVAERQVEVTLDLPWTWTGFRGQIEEYLKREGTKLFATV